MSYIAIVGVIYGMEKNKNIRHRPFETMYVQHVQQHLFMSSKCWKNNISTLLADVDNRRKGMMRCTSPPGLLMYKYKGLVLSTLSRYSMVARIWLPNSSSMYWPMKIMRSRYCMQYFVGVSTTTVNPPKSDAGPLVDIKIDNSKCSLPTHSRYQPTAILLPVEYGRVLSVSQLASLWLVHGMLSCPFPCINHNISITYSLCNSNTGLLWSLKVDALTLHKLFAVLDHGMKLLDLAFGHSIPVLRVSSNIYQWYCQENSTNILWRFSSLSQFQLNQARCKKN